jgi:hypothetical protein
MDSISGAMTPLKKAGGSFSRGRSFPHRLSLPARWSTFNKRERQQAVCRRQQESKAHGAKRNRKTEGSRQRAVKDTTEDRALKMEDRNTKGEN